MSFGATWTVRLKHCYWQVISDLLGDGVTDEQLAALAPAFIAKLDNPREAGLVLVAALTHIDWDWPLWHAFARKEGYDTVADVAKLASRLTCKELLSEATKPELLALAAGFGFAEKSSATRQVLIDRLAVLPAAKLKPALHPVTDRLTQKALVRCRKSMGLFLAVRVSSLAHNTLRYEQLLDPDFRNLRPFWQFKCAMDTPPPKECRPFNGKILPVAAAQQTFPQLPCDVLNCSCRIHAVATAKG